jgi:hypothetical protein
MYLQGVRTVVQQFQHVRDVDRVLDDEVVLNVKLSTHQLSTSKQQ